MNSKLLIWITISSLFLLCIPKKPEENFTRKEIVNFTDNEKTVVFNNDSLKEIRNSNLNLRYRVLPYIESKNETINVNDLVDSYNILISYDQNLFNKLDSYNFKIIPFSDQYHKVNLDLRYKINSNTDEKYFPTVILMVQHGKIWPGLTSFKGVGLKIFIRFTIFNRNGEELAFCQKKLIKSIFSNDFFDQFIISNNSPFLTDLNNSIYNNSNEFMIFNIIRECKKELNLMN
ncbi:hypothetical protein ND861_19100 [Leptospira sp. 2 VSF19]|uniref:Lipoprotein n=1 Tax=Leptospira soteropolitanensis TaxID=2950025 RepID=A0AAW5VUG1_9LEPT|nr:hypothetical protein [Leptospira soteropolitanensis]MCW7494782.1 hypothetical protein [Leptospira soteropolitanensis]MCW7502373.1 hypothetical protein [Leptospira soteropolitanensis]MCW7524609.1 hypothetical protein [Leptospira soteropolitanensis]MCW7528472.1 hypothetical protein [Leptospira soteropolitanensis]MCW7532339.1 hypothetical protein [Leptospira soteropolitanensis]